VVLFSSGHKRSLFSHLCIVGYSPYRFIAGLDIAGAMKAKLE
jgi:hypothetical protein